MNTTTTATLPVLPLVGGVVFPQMVVTIGVDSDDASAAAEAAQHNGGTLLLVPRTPDGYAKIGVIATVETAGELPNGHRALVVRGVARARIGTGVPAVDGGAALWVQVDEVPGEAPTDVVAELAREYRVTVEALLEARGASHLVPAIAAIDEPSVLADTMAYWPELSMERRVELLECLGTEDRLRLALRWTREALADTELKERIRTDVTEGMERQQREYLLRQQLAAIRKELSALGGENGETESGTAPDYRRRLAEAAVPDAVRTAAEREIDRLERMSEQSPEQSWVRTWLDTVFDIAWSSRSIDSHDVVGARAVLDDDTTGLDEAKDRIVEWLAVRSLRASRRDALTDTPTNAAPDTSDDGPAASITSTKPARRGDGAIIVLVGPPGVGKTSLGESVARALGRSFVRVALGGVRDEAEIRGHRRTYVGAQPGRIVRALREAKTMNPVILLDEIDKLGTGWAGDPSAALLEVLDPAQNHTFRDHYLEVDLDLSDVVFLATANSLDTIPAPLLDRMELIAVDGYTDDEKVAIGRKHLLPRQLEQNGILRNEVSITDAALRRIVEGYTREAGVRGLERQLAKVLRKLAMKVATNPSLPAVEIDSDDDVRGLLGRPKRVIEEVASRAAVPGVATGLAVTGAGGDVLFVEVTSMPAGGDDASFTVTGQLGDVMKESASIALSYVRANAEALGIADSSFRGRKFHVHFPAGAVPKDGPSAGITMTTALVSLLTGRAVSPTVAMTGEITLQGRVLPIGGVKQKVLAAKRAGLRTVIVPIGNEADLDDVPEAVRESLDIRPATTIAEVLAVALLPAA